MGTLHLNGTLDLSGRLTLGDKVLVDGKEVLVALKFGEMPPHSIYGVPPSPPPPTEPIWASSSEAVHVQVIEKLVVVNGAICIQGVARTKGLVRAAPVKVTIGGVAVAVTMSWAQMPTASVMLTASGQSK